MNGKLENKIHEQIRMDLRKKVGCHVANQVWDDIDVVYYTLLQNLKRNN